MRQGLVLSGHAILDDLGCRASTIMEETKLNGLSQVFLARKYLPRYRVPIKLEDVRTTARSRLAVVLQQKVAYAGNFLPVVRWNCRNSACFENYFDILFHAYIW